MELQQSVHNNNSSCRSTSNTARTLAPPIASLTIITTNTTPTTATIANVGATSATSPCSSPKAIVNHHNHHHNHHNSNTQSLVTQKSNQVSTVLLYGIPIVSLYIEGQERLCLAQISNTLLKQFSYNEIHNRRVALGITCVQCTPVQLEILRRAGAMPVSSRRCGMITRREAERLCKSFLGDNSPPRLPEDFAFNVQHKCAWGCRGSFLPSRYNSSRAKCIKCHYCGMFFSPNKFIFHSHRIGPGDKYVQPDAANFNSWRRHMMLTGQPPQEVSYAWEDVKAMFNGGTRKRLMTTNGSSPIPRVRNPSPSSSSAGTSANSLNEEQLTTIDDEFPVSGGEPPLKNIQKVQKATNAVNTMTAAAAEVGVTAVAVGSSVRPLSLHYHSSAPAAAAGLTRESSSYADMNLLPAAAFSRSIVMDYMWQHANQAAKNTYNQQYQPQNQQQQQPQQQKLKGCKSAFTLPWIKAKAGTVRLEAQSLQDYASSSENKNYNGSLPNVRFSSPMNTLWTNPASLSQIINTSAFKPVLQHQKQPVTLPSTRPSRRQSTPTLLPLPAPVLASNTATLPDQILDKTFKSSFKSDDDDDHDDEDDYNNTSPRDDKHFETGEESEAIEDDIMVDIETTEDENPIDFVANTIAYTTCIKNSFSAENLESPDNNEDDDDCDNVVVVDREHENSSDEDVIDVVHNDNDDTVLEHSSLTPLTITKSTRVNAINSFDVTSTVTSPISLLKCPKDLEKLCNIDKLNCLDYSNAENVPPPSFSVSPTYNSGSSCSQTSECFYVHAKGDNSPSYYDINTDTKNTTPRTSSKSPESTDNQTFNFHPINIETHKTSRKRSSTKYHGENEKLPWKPSEDVDTTMFNESKNNADSERREESNTADRITKCKKKSVETSAKGSQFFEALTQKYELTYYNNNNSCKSNYNNNNANSCNNNNTNIISNNSTNNNGNEFWHMARLCMQRPISYEQNQKQQQHQQQQHYHQQLSRLPTFYYRQQQFILTPAEQQQQQQEHYLAPKFPANQPVYLQHQQNLQAAHKLQNSNNEATSQNLTSHPATILTATSNAATMDENDVTATCANSRQKSRDTPAKNTRANGII